MTPSLAPPLLPPSPAFSLRTSRSLQSASTLILVVLSLVVGYAQPFGPDKLPVVGAIPVSAAVAESMCRHVLPTQSLSKP